MCLFEKKEPNAFSQGGTYDQYRRWIGGHPDLCGVRPFDAFLVWRSLADSCLPAQVRHSEQDQ